MSDVLCKPGQPVLGVGCHRGLLKPYKRGSHRADANAYLAPLPPVLDARLQWQRTLLPSAASATGLCST